MVEVSIVSLDGKQVKNDILGYLLAGDHNKEVQLNGLDAGIYFLQLQGDKETVTKKITIQ